MSRSDRGSRAGNGRVTQGVLAIQLEDNLATSIGWFWIDDPDVAEVFPAG